MSLQPARLEYAADGTPWSRLYGDRYHSAQGALGQARHVFLAGNGLPERWRGRRRFIVLELGFGAGVNFLATWLAWREDAARPVRLHYVAVEKHPFGRADLEAYLAREPALAPLARTLCAAWPPLVAGVHRLEFDASAVVLTLALGEAESLVPQLRLAADAVYLDGFAPARNPQMWSRALLRAVAARCARGASAATWSVAATVREALAAAGFAWHKRRGYGAKREMLAAQLVKGGVTPAAPAGERHAIVVGFGLAGASVCERLAARGWTAVALEAQAPPSGRHAALFHPEATADDSVRARATRAAFFLLRARLRALEAAGAAPRWHACGLLRLARDAREAEAQVRAIARLAAPAEHAAGVDAQRASAIAGVRLAAPALWYPSAGWVMPASLVAALLRATGGRATVRWGTRVAAIERRDARWRALDAEGRVLAEADTLVLANGAEAERLYPSRAHRLRRVRGQLSFLPAGAIPAPCVALAGNGYLVPEIDGVLAVGASYDADDEPGLRIESHRGNLARLAALVAEPLPALDPATLAGAVGFRAVSHDRLPLCGPLADEFAAAPRTRLARVPGLWGCYGLGSRGLLWSALGAELLASELEGEPWPVEVALAQALDPGRFYLRALRRGLIGPGTATLAASQRTP